MENAHQAVGTIPNEPAPTPQVATTTTTTTTQTPNAAPAQGAGATAAGPAVAVAPTKKKDELPVLGPVIELFGGGLTFIAGVGLTGYLFLLVMTYFNVGLVTLAGACMALGILAKEIGHYLTLKAEGRADKFDWIDGLLGLDPDRTRRVAKPATA